MVQDSGMLFSKIYVHQNFVLWKVTFFQELRKLSQDGNAMDHSRLVLLMGNETKIVAWRKFALAGNRTRASRVAGENSTTEPPVLVHLNTLTSCKRTLGLLKKSLKY